MGRPVSARVLRPRYIANSGSVCLSVFVCLSVRHVRDCTARWNHISGFLRPNLMVLSLGVYLEECQRELFVSLCRKRKFDK